MEGTIVTDAPDTIAPEAVELSPQADETDLLAGLVETEARDGVETETPDGEDPFATLTDEDIAKNPKVAKLLKDADYRKEQALKDVRENARREAERAAAAEQVRRESEAASQEARAEALRQLTGLQRAYDAARERGDPVSPEAFQQSAAQIAATLDAQAYFRSIERLTGATGAYLNERYPGWQLRPELQERFVAASAKKDQVALAQIVLDTVADVAATAAAAKVTPEVREQIRKELVEEAKAKALERQSAERTAGGAPTAVTGTARLGTFRPRTQADVDRALYEGRIDSKTAREWTNKGLPYN